MTFTTYQRHSYGDSEPIRKGPRHKQSINHRQAGM